MTTTMQQGAGCPGCGDELIWDRYKNDDATQASYYKCHNGECDHDEVRMDVGGKLVCVARKYTGGDYE